MCPEASIIPSVPGFPCVTYYAHFWALDIGWQNKESNGWPGWVPSTLLFFCSCGAWGERDERGGSILDELQLNGVGHGHQSRGKLGYDYTTVFGIGASIGRTTDQDQRQLLQGAREDARLEGFSPYHCCLFFFLYLSYTMQKMDCGTTEPQKRFARVQPVCSSKCVSV